MFPSSTGNGNHPVSASGRRAWVIGCNFGNSVISHSRGIHDGEWMIMPDSRFGIVPNPFSKSLLPQHDACSPHYIKNTPCRYCKSGMRRTISLLLKSEHS